jgi:thiaminase (transcriptional activator TenA)
MSFFAETRRQADPIWQAVFDHPFVRGIGDGTLPLERFRYYLGQDYKYIIRYAQMRAVAVAKARDISAMRTFADGVNFILNGEALFHRHAAEYLGTSVDDFAAGEMAPTNRAYTDFLATVAYSGSLGELISAMLPCLYGYCEIGRHLASSIPDHPLYARWIQTYAGEEMWQRALWNGEFLDRLAAEASAGERNLIASHFLTGSRYEYMFFDMGWREEKWPV